MLLTICLVLLYKEDSCCRGIPSNCHWKALVPFIACRTPISNPHADEKLQDGPHSGPNSPMAMASSVLDPGYATAHKLPQNSFILVFSVTEFIDCHGNFQSPKKKQSGPLFNTCSFEKQSHPSRFLTASFLVIGCMTPFSELQLRN